MAKDRNESWEWIKALLIALLFAFIIRTFFLTPIVVEGASMMPTLRDQDRMVVSKVGEPKRFDIVVFHATENTDYIKRVIGLPGDRIEYKDDTLFVNGKAYKEPYLDEYKREIETGPLTASFKLEETAVGSATVPKGQLFVMGDNRRKSKDSRRIGAIPMDKVIGTTKIVYYPIKEIKIIGK
ncbi:signal peptidase I [Neobacillus drentensis]|uniref:signal peptidase I n=1 Tax=Neobacillus drentensis TaxID=220684 RepID=UPI001F3A5151|nr:signal peptidase I [Neobacillus drentensis]ULT59434.1 signal peptidase I [Neobacillus drentensis]